MKIVRTHKLVVCRSMVLRHIVCHVCCSRSPVNGELALLYTVSEPVETHVDCLGAFLFDCVIKDAHGAFIVGLEGCGRLGMAQVAERLSDGAGVLGVQESRSNLSFCSRAKDVFHDGGYHMNRAIAGWVVNVAIAQVVVASGSGSGLGGR